MKIFNRDTFNAAYEASRTGKPIELFGSRFVVLSALWRQDQVTGAGSGTVDMREVLAVTRAEGVVLPHQLDVTFNKD